MAHCLDPVYLGLVSDPTLFPCTPVLEKLFYGKRLASHLIPQVQMYLPHLLGKHLIMNLRSDLPSLNKWALSSMKKAAKRAVGTLSNVTGAADLPGWGRTPE